jgi:hypothetical protein
MDDCEVEKPRQKQGTEKARQILRKNARSAWRKDCEVEKDNGDSDSSNIKALHGRTSSPGAPETVGDSGSIHVVQLFQRPVTQPARPTSLKPEPHFYEASQT